jgi:hypothetical protein
MPPNFTKASYVDGHKRAGWQDMKEAAKLNKQVATARGDTKKEIKAEIRKMRVRMTKE